MVASFQVPALSGSGGISRGHRSSGRKELFCAFGIDVDAVAGWLGSYEWDCAQMEMMRPRQRPADEIWGTLRSSLDAVLDEVLRALARRAGGA